MGATMISIPTDISNPYDGKSRRELTEILILYRGDRERIPLPDLFEQAWRSQQAPRRRAGIPPQLKRDDLRFILLRPGTKGSSGNEHGWNQGRNYSYDDPILNFQLDDGWNYGVFPAAGSDVVVLDADEFHLLNQGLLSAIEGTFRVETGSSTGDKPKFHYYFRCTGLAGKMVFHDDHGKHLAEMYTQADPAARVGRGAGVHTSERKPVSHL